ncbi:hypothetical protein WK60_13785 [Burkholderia ubonensis]|nr:hypothetical protein WK60_13785 [Burkholderia ubonensis]
MVFNGDFDGKVEIQVTHECLTDKLGSDGTRDGDEKAIVDNMDRISRIALEKSLAGAASPIFIVSADF